MKLPSKEELEKKIIELEDKLNDLKKQLHIIQVEERDTKVSKFKNILEDMIGKYYIYEDKYTKEYCHIISLDEIIEDQIDGGFLGIIETIKLTTENGMDEIIHDPKDSIWENDKENYVEISKSKFMKKLKEFTDKYLPND